MKNVMKLCKEMIDTSSLCGTLQCKMMDKLISSWSEHFLDFLKPNVKV